MSNYIVKPGESINDVVINSTGSIKNLDAVLKANAFTDWTPDLVAGNTVVMPANMSLDPNGQRQFIVYPVSNNVFLGIRNKINNLAQLVYNNWILITHFWVDNSVWNDSQVWLD